MNFYDRITGNDMTKLQRAYTARVAQLPADYQAAWQTINQAVWQYSDFTGRNLYPLLTGILELLEESAAEGLSAAAVVGPDTKAFVAGVAQAEGASDYRERLRQKLNQTVAKKLGK